MADMKQQKQQQYQRRNELPWLHFSSGGISALASTVLLQPFDVVKTHLQRDNSTSSVTNKKGMISCGHNIIRSQGMRGLWIGTVPSVARTVPGVGLYFLLLQNIRSNLCERRRCRFNIDESMNVSLSTHETLFAGTFARALVGMLLLPITVVKVRTESGLYGYNSLMEALSTIARREHAHGLFGGLAATILRDAPFSGIYLICYEGLKNKVSSSHDSIGNAPISPITLFAIGVCSGVIATTITHPADVVKTRIQLSTGGSLSTLRAAMELYSEGGIRAFFCGLVPRALRRSFMASITWTVYEEMIRHSRLFNK